MRHARLLAAVPLLLLISACTVDDPTAPDLVSPLRSSSDGGGWVGGGGRAADGGGWVGGGGIVSDSINRARAQTDTAALR